LLGGQAEPKPAPVEKPTGTGWHKGEQKANIIFALVSPSDTLLLPGDFVPLTKQTKALQVLIAPSCIRKHRAQSPDRKRIA